MYESLLDVGTDLLAIVAYALGTLVLSVLGLVVEYNGFQRYLHGQAFLSAWFAFMGLVALAFAWCIGRRKLSPRLAQQFGA